MAKSVIDESSIQIVRSPPLVAGMLLSREYGAHREHSSDISCAVGFPQRHVNLFAFRQLKRVAHTMAGEAEKEIHLVTGSGQTKRCEDRTQVVYSLP